GVYHTENSSTENDVLWPKNSGRPGSPIVFKAYPGEQVILGGGSANYPDSAESLSPLQSPRQASMRDFLYGLLRRVANPSSSLQQNTSFSIARCVVTLKDVSYITLEGLHLKGVAGWVFARNCHHIVFRKCMFEDALSEFKGTARLLECQDCRVLECSFRNSS